MMCGFEKRNSVVTTQTFFEMYSRMESNGEVEQERAQANAMDFGTANASQPGTAQGSQGQLQRIQKR